MTVPEQRRLVPSARQRAVGDDAAGRLAAPTEALPESAEQPRRGLRALAHDLDVRTIEGPKLVLVVLLLTSLFARIDEAALQVLSPQVRAELGVGTAYFIMLASVVSVLSTLLYVPLGYLADRVTRVWMLRAGSVLSAGTAAAQGLAGSPAALAAARSANGLAIGIAPPATFPLLSDWFPRHVRTRVFAVFFIGTQLGVIVGPVIAGVLGDLIGWRRTVIALGGTAALVAMSTFLLKEPVRGAHDRPHADEVPAPPAPRFAEAYRAAGSIRTVRRLWYATPLLAARGAFMFILMPVFLSEVYGMSSSQLGVALSAVATGGLLGMLVAGPVGDRILAERPGRYLVVVGVVPLLMVLVIVVMTTRPPLPVAIGLLGVLVLCESALLPAFYALLSLVVPSRIRGLGLATTAPWTILGALLVPVLMTLAESDGLQRGILWFALPLLLGAVVLVTAAPGVEKDLRAARAADAADEAARRSRAEGRAALLVVRDLEVSYDGVPVLFGVDLDVHDGEVVALVGTNGAGKSTLLRALAGVQQPSGGAVFYDGHDTTHAPPHQLAERGVVMMPGGAAVFPGLTVEENLRATGATDLQPAFDAFPVLPDRLARRAGSLSGGEQQMVGLAQALLMRPRLLLVDELSLGLAPAVVEQLLEVVRALRDAGTTVVLVEQSLNVALTVADRAVFMEKGEVRFDGPVAELLARPDLVRSVFMGGAAAGTRGALRKPAVAEVAPALEVRGVAVAFGGVRALDGVDLVVRPGEVVGVIGPNGAGKTTLFDVVSGFVAPDEGQVLLAGVDVTRAAPDARARAGLGRSFQSARLFPALTVRECIAVALERKAVRSALLQAVRAPQVRVAERRISRQVERLVDVMGLGPWADAVLAELSTGTRRAVDVACVLAQEPSVLLLDEPTSGLAQAETEALGPLLSRIVRETGCGMLVIEHDIPLVTAVSDRLVAMEQGRVLVSGAPDEVRRDPRVLSSYLAASESVLTRSGTPLAPLLDPRTEAER